MLSHKARYALRALIALAQEEPGVQLTSGDISTKADAPRKFLEAILLQLSLTGLVISKRGKYGGYRLGRAPSDISFAEVIRIVDGPLALAPCVSRMAFRKCDDCPSLETCFLRDALMKTRDATSAVLEGYSLADALSAEAVPAL
jgi:Rrf2 family protein